MFWVKGVMDICLLVLAFLLGRKISYDVFSLLLVRVLLHMMLASARIYVGQENIGCYVFILLCWEVLANDVSQCSHLRWARKFSMTRFPCSFCRGVLANDVCECSHGCWAIKYRIT